MQILLIARALGILLCCEALLMLPSFVVALIYGDGDAIAFLYAIGITLAAGMPLPLTIRSHKRSLYARDCFALVGLGWLLISLFGALPYLFSGVTPRFVDAFFESVSGFSTTGSSILPFIEGQPRGILFWRSFSQWIGGIGVLVLAIAILPQVGSRNLDVMRAEVTGPAPGKLMPKLGESIRVLYTIYIALSALMAIALLLAGMPLYDALVNTFATAATGGFSVLGRSIGGYNSRAVEGIVAVFLLLFGINFALFFALLRRDFKKVLRNEELWLFLGVTALAFVLVLINIAPMSKSLAQAAQHAFFQVSSFVVSAGFTTTNYELWPVFSKVVLLILMTVGACAGSTSGGLKMARLLIMFKALRKEIFQLLHPRIVRPVLVDGKAVDESTLRSVLVFFFCFVVICILGMLVVALDGFSFDTTFTAVLSALNNTGVGFGAIGPYRGFADFSTASKLTLCVCMLLGRLEILPILLLFSPSIWRKG